MNFRKLSETELSQNGLFRAFENISELSSNSENSNWRSKAIKNPLFSPDRIMCVSLGDSDYSKARASGLFDALADLPEIAIELDNFREQMREFGFTEDDFIIINEND